jgi:glutamyl-tRNA synthetase
MGYTAEALVNYMTLLGWSPPEGLGERFSLEQAAAVFSFERVNRAGARFDWDKLNWLNAQVLHGLEAGELRRRLLPLWRARGWGEGPGADAAWQEDLCALLGPSLGLLADGVEQAAPFFETPEPDEAALALRADGPTRAALAALLEQLPEGPLEADAAQALLGAVATAAGVKKGVVMKGLRAALLGSLKGPDLLTTWLLLHRIGSDRERIAAAL